MAGRHPEDSEEESFPRWLRKHGDGFKEELFGNMQAWTRSEERVGEDQEYPTARFPM